MAVKTETWCDRDEHNLFELFVDFNEWVESEEAVDLREANGVDGLSQPSKAFFAGDKEAYDQAFREYREKRRNEVLNEKYLCEQFTDDHWFQRNLDHFELKWYRYSGHLEKCVIGTKLLEVKNDNEEKELLETI